ncbi:RNA methyltransferase, TrmH family [Aspergillus uvarum CBS 121591]|uniref:rRNA methyltransferase 1, mitochondrial n=1 Tax=Aspergillus uvarum CBS 121591 TaxID=1448315 RepID=A0A319CSY4_9EURO|nr:RNA methyltransferase, TrmH family [Aspergillus uvarum CBS 121591]PYH81863.1 RNA methyltransferase, TrmH family [Aspergillus uvarum CBS 121591]
MSLPRTLSKSLRLSHSTPLSLRLHPATGSTSVRHASLTSAIHAGIRRSRFREDKLDGGREERSGRSLRREETSRDGDRFPSFQRGEKSPFLGPQFDEDEFIRSGSFKKLSREEDKGASGDKSGPDYKQGRRGRVASLDRSDSSTQDLRPSKQKPGNARRKVGQYTHESTDQVPERVKAHVLPPTEIPYTTPASQFVFGTAAVEAALRCTRRQLYKLYIYQSEGESLSEAKSAIRKLALLNNVPVKMAFAEWDRLLDKMSAGRPHNGVVLEASPLPQLPVAHFHRVASVTEENFQVELGVQSREEAAVNGTDTLVPINHARWLADNSESMDSTHRYPVVLLLDGVQDPGNMGAIIRSAYYLGIDAVVLAGRNSAPLTPVTIKASAGAAENMPLLAVRNEQEFITQSKENGWRFFAADMPGPASQAVVQIGGGTADVPAIAQAPCVLMMGSEGTGLSSHLLSAADAKVGIPGARFDPRLGVESDPARVDSLNVSVAAALLMERILQSPVMVDESSVKKTKKTTKGRSRK